MSRLNIQSEEELVEKLSALEITDEEQKKEITCSLIGHSKIQTSFFGYFNCARCGEQLGDTLGGCYSGAADAVIVGHKCPTCEANYKKLSWKDKVFCPDPFADDN